MAITSVCKATQTRCVRLGRCACFRVFSGVEVGDFEEGRVWAFETCSLAILIRECIPVEK